MSIQEQKLALIQGLLLIQDKSIIKQIDELIKLALSKDMDKPTYVDFQTWNEQFGTDENLEVYQEEYGMTLGEFRKQIWTAEMNDAVELDTFFKMIED